MRPDRISSEAPGGVFEFPAGGPGNGVSAAIRFGFAAERIVDLGHFESGVLYHECLARMLMAENVRLNGGAFVPDLERGGAIRLLDVAIVGLVLDALEDDLHARLGCNISPCTLADRSAWDELVRCIAARPSLAPRLTLEITESAPLDEIAEAPVRLRALRSLGCSLALDDFGAGFATGERLRRLAFDWDVVKLDRSCFGDLRKTPSARDGLHSLVTLASCFAPVVVVEGIETEEHLLIARRAGARYGQGWLFKGPVRERWTAPGEAVATQLAAAIWEGRERTGPAGPADEVLPAATIACLADRARLRAVALRRRFGAALSPAELDRVFVHYLYGLVIAALSEAAPQARLSLLRQLGGLVLEPDALTCALHARAPARRSGDDCGGAIGSILTAAETFGGRDAAALVESCSAGSANAAVAGGATEPASPVPIRPLD